ncbi:chloride channel protein, CIC family [Lebetimonas natsushimae]|uniref:Chloride channel protein, CIC family n=1 Tax=Lebetimonas natsushimae TaxID=1936991 RepID=A0A292YFM0_9BACT|nr:chloride channel protein [Lebetimonas natsushimae]GAX88208.1 chloride channel protein, CIC family [Lebetimonas natsushimae]
MFFKDFLKKISSKISLIRDFLIASIITGFISGVFIVLYYYLMENISKIFFGKNPVFTLSSYPKIYIYLITIFSILIVNFIIYKDRKAKEYGVEQIAQIITEKQDMINMKDLIMKILASALSIGSGFAVGTEGPSAEIGAMIGYKIHSFFKFPETLLKPMISIGASSGIAAIFVSPITGIAFAIESIAYNFIKSYITFIIVGSISAFSIALIFLQPFTFIYSAGRMINFKYVYIIALFIPFMTLLIYLYLTIQDKILYFTHLKLFNVFGKYKDLIFAIIGGVVIATILIISPYAGFTGHQIVSLLINNENLNVLFIIEILLLRIIATTFSIYSNAVGGMFVPLMSIGALSGYLFGLILHYAHVGIGLEPFYFAAIGSAVFMGVLMKLPLTSVVLALEITNDYNVVIATGFSVAIISYLTKLNFNIKKFNTININFNTLTNK